MTEDSLVYTNLLMYSPVASPDGVIRMEEAVIPIECHYERSVCLFFFFFLKSVFIVLWAKPRFLKILVLFPRKYSLSSSSLTPTWIPFISTQAAVETLEFDLRVMTSGFCAPLKWLVCLHLGLPQLSFLGR